MKREAVGTTKMKRLCKLLNVRQYVAVGIMESLWHLTAREAPQGDIGKLSDEDIALGIDWDGDPEELVQALVKARWVDESKASRLIVHDWHEHADDAVDVRLARAILFYANGAQPRMTKLSRDEKEKLRALYAHAERTKAHNGALPVPVPVPLPEPVPVPVPVAAAPEAPAKSQGAPPDSVDARCLCETVGIFGMREQAEMLRCLTAFCASSASETEPAIQHMVQRWREYSESAPTLEWQYGSAYKFFMSGKWDDPRSWPRGKVNGSAEWSAFKAQLQAEEGAA